MRSLAERLRAFEQKKARLADMEAQLKLAEKKSHIRRCIRIGDLASKAGLADWPDDALYGAMLMLDRADEAKRRHWGMDGAAALAVRDTADDDRQPVVLTFASHPVGEAAAAIRAGGFHFNRLMRHWEGLALIDEAELLAQAHGGVARRVTL